jgi:hypothetical protein
MKRGKGIKVRVDRSSGIEILMTDAFVKINPPQDLEKEKNSWLLGKMLESGFPDASGREEG